MRRSAMKLVVAPAVGLTLALLAAAQASQATTTAKNGLIAYGAEVNGHYQLFTIAPNGTGVKQITHFADGSDAVNPDWSPDGKLIAFEHDFPYPHAGVYTMDADGGNVKAVTPDQRLLFEGNPAYSPDGTMVAIPQEVHHDENTITPRDYGVIVVRRLDGTVVREVSPRIKLTPNDVPHLEDPNFSPDGKWLSFLRVNKDEVLQALFRVHADGTGLRQLTPYSWDVAIKHDWSPDGKLIVLTRNADFANASESANLVIIRPDGSGAKQLTRFKAGGRSAYAGSFSPDGKQIVFRLEQGDKYAIAVIDRNGKHLRLITKLSSTKPRFIDWGTHP
jgi:Tol biopolymer transport system component